MKWTLRTPRLKTKKLVVHAVLSRVGFETATLGTVERGLVNVSNGSNPYVKRVANKDLSRNLKKQ